MSLCRTIKPERPWAVRHLPTFTKTYCSLMERLRRNDNGLAQRMAETTYKCDLAKMEKMLDDPSSISLIIGSIKERQDVARSEKNLRFVSECLTHENPRIRWSATTVLRELAKKGFNLTNIYDALENATKDKKTKHDAVQIIMLGTNKFDDATLCRAMQIILTEWDKLDQDAVLHSIRTFNAAAARGVGVELAMQVFVHAMGNEDEAVAYEASRKLLALVSNNADSAIATVLPKLVELCKNGMLNGRREESLRNAVQIFKAAAKRKKTEELAIQGMVAMITGEHYRRPKAALFVHKDFEVTLFNQFLSDDLKPEQKTKIIYALVQSRKFTAEAGKNSTAFEKIVREAARVMAKLKHEEEKCLSAE